MYSIELIVTESEPVIVQFGPAAHCWLCFAAIHCSSIEGILSEHMTFRLLIGRLGEFGSIMMLECSSGYFLGVGHRTLHCRANGTWEGSDDPAMCKSKQLNRRH